MEINGVLKSITIEGPKSTPIVGELAVNSIRIDTPNPYTADGVVYLSYKANTLAYGLVEAADGGRRVFKILDEELLTKEFEGVPYPTIIKAIKEISKFIIGRTYDSVEHI